VNKLRSLLDLKRLSILQQVSGGICIILLLLIALSIIYSRTINSIYSNAEYVDRSMTAGAAVTQFVNRVGETRAYVTQYALSESDLDLRIAQRSLDGLNSEIQTMAEVFTHIGETKDIVDNLSVLASRYRYTVTATIQAINTRRDNGAKLLQSTTELSTTVAAIVELLSRDADDTAALDDAVRLMEAFHSSVESATRFLASRNPADSDTSRVDMQAMDGAMRALQAHNIANPRIHRFMDAMGEPLDRYGNAVAGLVAATEQFARVGTQRTSAAAALIDATRQVGFTANEAQTGTVSEMMISVVSGRRQGYITSCLAIIACIILVLVIGRGIANPIRQITAVMRELAGGKVDVVIPYLGRSNEIGAMAEAVRVFRDNKIKANHLAVENDAQRQSREQRAKNLEALNQHFESTAAALTSTLASAAVSLKQSAESMFASTRESSQRSQSGGVAAKQVFDNVGTVAGATEELTTSIEAISDSASRSSLISTQTSEGAASANRAVQALAGDASKIERIVSLIKDIAQQTNLLALNATIEAARAGEAGRGFAVVASEVKTLALETANATKEIESQISRVQSVIKTVVTQIQEIDTQIGEMNVIATSVAVAVDQQRGATRTIADSAQQALSSAMHAVEAIASIEDAANATKVEADQVLGAAKQVSQQSDDLHTAFDRFIEGVRAA
jgi:methyl-accepting chemotaxis protein